MQNQSSTMTTPNLSRNSLSPVEKKALGSSINALALPCDKEQVSHHLRRSGESFLHLLTHPITITLEPLDKYMTETEKIIYGYKEPQHSPTTNHDHQQNDKAVPPPKPQPADSPVTAGARTAANMQEESYHTADLIKQLSKKFEIARRMSTDSSSGMARKLSDLCTSDKTQLPQPQPRHIKERSNVGFADSSDLEPPVLVIGISSPTKHTIPPFESSLKSPTQQKDSTAIDSESPESPLIIYRPSLVATSEKDETTFTKTLSQRFDRQDDHLESDISRAFHSSKSLHFPTSSLQSNIEKSPPLGSPSLRIKKTMDERKDSFLSQAYSPAEIDPYSIDSKASLKQRSSKFSRLKSRIYKKDIDANVAPIRPGFSQTTQKPRETFISLLSHDSKDSEVLTRLLSKYREPQDNFSIDLPDPLYDNPSDTLERNFLVNSRKTGDEGNEDTFFDEDDHDNDEDINGSGINKDINKDDNDDRAAKDEEEEDSFIVISDVSEIELFKMLGAGIQGRVFLAIHTETRLKFAVKIEDVSENPAKNIELRNEVLNQVQLCPHKNICYFYGALYDAFSRRLHTFLEYMDAGSLSYALSKLGSIPEIVLSVIMRDCLKGLAFMHENGFINRDIKSANILLSFTKKCAKLTDLGMAIIAKESTDFGGTIEYFPPERLNGEAYGAPGDIWALGIVAIEGHLGSHPCPFRPKYWDFVLSEKPDSKYFAGCQAYASSAFQDFVSCCLQQDPAQRWTALQLLDHPWITKYENRRFAYHAWLSRMEGLRKSQYITEFSRLRDRL